MGNELDLTARVIFTPRVNLLLGFLQFWGGDLVDATNPSFVSGNASFAYAQLSLRF